MKTIVEYARVYLISPEVATVLAAAAILVVKPTVLEALGRTLLSGGTGLDTALFFAPFALAMLSYKWGDDILNPPDKAALIEWPDYWRLRLRVWASLAFAALGITAWVIGFLMLTLSQAHAIAACLIVASGGLLLVSTATVGVARLMIKEILAGV